LLGFNLLSFDLLFSIAGNNHDKKSKHSCPVKEGKFLISELKY
jgi:hypothetical protein